MADDPTSAVAERPVEQTAPPAAPPSAPAAPPAAEAQPIPEPAAAVPTTAPTDWEAILDTVDEKDLFSHKKLAGKIGTLAERQAKKIVDEAIARDRAERAAAEQERLDQAEKARMAQLRDTDPVAFAEESRKREEAEARKSATYSELVAIAQAEYNDLPDDLKAKFSGKNYPAGSAGVRQFLKEARAEVAAFEAGQREQSLRAEFDEKLEKEVAKRLKDERPAIRKEVLAELNGGRPAPDTGATASNGTGLLTQEEFDRNRKVPGWVRANMDRVTKAMAEGRVTR